MRSTELSRTVSRPICFVVGGIDLHSLDSDTPGRIVYAYDPEQGEWRQMTNLQNYTHHHGVASMNGKLYVVGMYSVFFVNDSIDQYLMLMVYFICDE